MVAYIRTLAVEKNRWLDEDAFRDGVALCQAIPGATAMQTAAYVGLRARGLPGAAVTFLGFGLPAFVLMMALSALYTRARALPTALSLFAGLKCIVIAIVANATISFGRAYLRDRHSALIAAVSVGLFALCLNPMIVILFAGAAGLALHRGQSSPPSRAALPFSRGLLLVLAGAVAGLAALFLLHQPLFDLAVLMVRIDLFAFGGGFASIPLMLHEIVDVRAGLDATTFLDGIALGQITPGPIVITATFVGYLLQGPIGGIVATVSVFLPSFVLVVGTAPYFDRLRQSPHFHKVIGGVLCSFVGLLLTVAFRFALNVPWDLPRAALAATAFVAMLWRVDILWVVLAGTMISVFCL